ncbi:hypothetical protein SAMN04488116_2395 [Flagellimonas flava]|uniref:Uncharacterized protein n=1 Tax=Flagellimonas flava TaxID=570519 RepID=A0A1M5MEL4_9FLAO|nr:hypothetical protein SAMN04488116_2395 [Allomuricauda flava]
MVSILVATAAIMTTTFICLLSAADKGFGQYKFPKEVTNCQCKGEINQYVLNDIHYLRI